MTPFGQKFMSLDIMSHTSMEISFLKLEATLSNSEVGEEGELGEVGKVGEEGRVREVGKVGEVGEVSEVGEVGPSLASHQSSQCERHF